MKNDSCPKCNSTDVIPNAEIINCAANHSLRCSVSFASNSPSAAEKRTFCKVAKSGEMRAWICGRCGFTEIYTLGIKELSLNYKQNKIK
jgi:predicted nucleic-acid-binding Zn-ribbon protein